MKRVKEQERQWGHTPRPRLTEEGQEFCNLSFYEIKISTENMSKTCV